MSTAQELVAKAASKAAQWHAMTPAERLPYLEDALARLPQVAEEWAAVFNATTVHADPATHPMSAQLGRVLNSGATGGWTNVWAQVLRSVVASGGDWEKASSAIPIEPRGNDFHAAVVLPVPGDTLSKVAMGGQRGELWLRTKGERRSLQADEPGVCVVLGAGNFGAPIEVLHKLFQVGHTCVYKPNPVNGPTTVFGLTKVFTKLVEDGFVVVVEDKEQYSSIPFTSDLLKAGDEWIITGSDKTFDAIVWGPPGEEQAARKKRNEPVLCKPCEAELGNVNLITVVPGEWTDAELKLQAAQIAELRLLNGGHICASPQLMVLDAEWPQRQQFVDMVKKELAEHLPVPSYYPNVDKKLEAFVEHFGADKAKPLTEKCPTLDNHSPVLFVDDVGDSDYMLKNESFGPIMGVKFVAGVGGDTDAFLTEAVRIVNEEAWGNLATTVLVCDATDKAMHERIVQAVSDLRVGAIGINIWGGNVVLNAQLRWGGYDDDNTLQDVQSGIGPGVGNVHGFVGVVKSVIWAPSTCQAAFTPLPSEERGALFFGRIDDFMASPSWWRLTKMLSAKMIGW